MAKVKMTTKDYKKYGTVVSGGKRKLPIKNRQSAKNALKLMSHTDPPLSSGQQASVRRRAKEFGVQSADSAQKSAKKPK